MSEVDVSLSVIPTEGGTESDTRKRSFEFASLENKDDNLAKQPRKLAALQNEKVKRPPNGFIIYSNEWRKKLAALFPDENNNQISVRLGGMWRAMKVEDKEEYFALARQADSQHKLKYPEYVYNPEQAREQKRLRDKARKAKLRRSRRQSKKRRLKTAQTTSARLLPAPEHQWGGTTGTQGFLETPEEADIHHTTAQTNSARLLPAPENQWGGTPEEADIHQFFDDEIPELDDFQRASFIAEVMKIPF
ncbi:sex-determining region Y protein-like [Zootermopsis nevadensis]|uniref:sex-determining region Y protein-like n=1 Tax=Zootermopsis nevadensis TaxID=136037 RepID=UPI000B8E50E9|nr:sex-determining region Y protein-like [Zootermopsis nevadensis]